MKNLTLRAILCFALLAPSFAQHSNWPHPPEAADPSVNTRPSQPPKLRFQADPLQMQREAKELLELSQSLQPDMEQVGRGLLPKDTIEKLKQIEKLSKRLRGELQR